MGDGALSVVIVFVICVLIYLPFVKMANDQALRAADNSATDSPVA